MLFLKKRLILLFVAIVLISFALFIRVSDNYSKACDEYAENGLKGRISSEINENLISVINESSYNNGNLLELTYNEQNELKAVSVNSEILNIVALELANSVYESIASAEASFGFPIGNVTGHKFLSGKGPNIKVEVVPVGAVEYEIKSELVSGGINQTLYRLKIDYTSQISVIAPFFGKESKIETCVIIAELLIIGNVPNVVLPFGE